MNNFDFNNDEWDLVKASTVVNWKRGKKSEIVVILLKALFATFEEIKSKEFELIFNKHFKDQVNIANKAGDNGRIKGFKV